MPAPDDRLWDVLAEAVRRGLLGPAIAEHLEHTAALGELIEEAHDGPPPSLLDLGSGGGVPGLVLAARWPACEVVLLDGQARRARHLRDAVARLALGSATVAEGRAETLAHEPELRERFAVVTARAFGPPPVTAECAAGFLALGGTLLGSEPPGAPDGRWDEAGLAQLGLELVQRRTEPVAAVLVAKRLATSPRYPRRPGQPQKRHLW